MARLEAPIAALANQLMDRIDGAKAVDFGPAFSVPLPSQVFLTLMGLPLDQLDDFLAMKDGIIRPEVVTRTPPSDPVAVAYQKATAAHIYAYFEEALESRRRTPEDDLLTRFLAIEIDGRPPHDGHVTAPETRSALADSTSAHSSTGQPSPGHIPMISPRPHGRQGHLVLHDPSPAAAPQPERPPNTATPNVTLTGNDARGRFHA